MKEKQQQFILKSQKNQEYREYWVDFAKAIGIIMVVLAHSLPKDNYLWIWINLFHMPLFFCISGYLYSCKDTFLRYAIKKTRSLWIPFEISSFITYVFYIFIGLSFFSIKEIAKIILMVSPGPLLGATWFIPVLLFTCVLYDLIYRVVRKFDSSQGIKIDIIIFIICILFLVVGIKTALPYRGSVILRSFIFFHLGQMIRKYINSKNSDLIVGVVLMLVVSIVAFFNTTSYLNNIYTSIPLFLISAISGSVGVCLISRFTCNHISSEKIKGILLIGKNTIGPLIWQFVTFKIVFILQILHYKLPWNKILDFPVIYEYAHGVWVFLDVVVGIMVSILIYKTINMPFDILAKKIEKKIIDKYVKLKKEED